MPHTLDEWVERERAILGGVNVELLPPGDAEAVVKQAIKRHSRLFPQRVFFDFPGDGSAYDIPITSLTQWVDGYSTVDQIEFPYGERDPVIMDNQGYALYPDDSNPISVRLLNDTPSTGETARVFYTAPWPIPNDDPVTDLIAETDWDAVCYLAAYFAAQQLASRAAGHTRPTLPAAQLAGVEGEAERWEARKDALLAVYLEHFGIDPESTVPADGIIDWDAISSFVEYGSRFLFRGRR